MSLPLLPNPQENEIYARFVDTEFNCLSCPKGKKGVQNILTNHTTWLYQSITALEKDDFLLVGGDFWFFDTEKNNSYYPGGFMQAVIDAMKRGAKVMTIIDEYYVGDILSNCPDNPKGYLYADWACKPTLANYNILKNAGGDNYYPYIIPLSSQVHSHCKLISFYYKSKNLTSFFMGSWNLSTSATGNGMKETGFGFVSNLKYDFGQYALFRDLNICQTFEKYNPTITKKISDSLKELLSPNYQNKPPVQPIQVSKVYYIGPNFCDKNFGCGASGNRNNDNTCTDNETFTMGIDQNVSFTFGVDPPPNFGHKFWNQEMKFGADLLVQLINGAKKYIKTSIHSQCLENDARPGFGTILPQFQKAIFDSLNNKINWFCLQNTGWENVNPTGGSLIAQISRDRNKWKNMYPKIFKVCGRINESWCKNGDTGYVPCYENLDTVNTKLTHDKLWLSDNAILLSTAHPSKGHYYNILNEELLIQNAPNLLNYLNNHWNSLWNNCGEYTDNNNYNPRENQYYSGLGDMTCPDNSDNVNNCCQTKDILNIPKDLKNDPYFSKYCAGCENSDNKCCLNCCQNSCCQENETCVDDICQQNCGNSPPCQENETCIDNRCQPNCGNSPPCSNGEVCSDGSCLKKCQKNDKNDKNEKNEKNEKNNKNDKKRNERVERIQKIQKIQKDEKPKNTQSPTSKTHDPRKIVLYTLSILFLFLAFFMLYKKQYIPLYIYFTIGVTIFFIGLFYRNYEIVSKSVVPTTSASTTKNPDKPIPHTDKPIPPTDEPKPDCIPVEKFNKVDSLSDSGFCKGYRDSYPYYQNLAISDLNDCQTSCENDDKCVAFNFNDGTCQDCQSYSCQLFSLEKDAKYSNGPSTNWNAKNIFPTYSSPYMCPDKIDTLKCPNNTSGRPLYPDKCTKLEGWKCYSKTPNFEIKSKKYDVGEKDTSGCRIIISNPFISNNYLLHTENTFYNWFYNMINNANKFIILANAYIKLGIHYSEDPNDYQSQIYYAFKNALERGVQISCVRVKYDVAECGLDQKDNFSQFANQPGIKEHLNKNLKYVDFGQNSMNFFHDKVYISENEGYIGGQNLSSSASIDIGIVVNSDSPLYSDMLEKAKYLLANSNYKLNFQYTSENPYIEPDNSGKYYLTVSPYQPICQKLQGENCNFPQNPCPENKNEVGTYITNGDWNNNSGRVTYEWNQIRNIFKNAQKFIFVTNYDLSIFGDALAEKNGYDTILFDEIKGALSRGVIVDLWINNSPISDNLCYGNPTCNLFRCEEGQKYMDELKAFSNFKIHFWFQNPIGKYNDCKVLHAKIYYSDYGILISSSNFTPSYFSGTLGTGICNIFGKEIPDWVEKGIDIIKNILTTAKVQNAVCDNPEPNFYETRSDGSQLCDNKGGCQNTCVKAPLPLKKCKA